MSARGALCSKLRIVYFSSLFVLVSGYPRERRSCAIQSREAYFAGIAAPCEGFGVLAPAALPSASSPASSAPPRWSLERARGAGWRRSPGRSTTGGLGRDRSRGHGHGYRACRRAHGSLTQRCGVSFQIAPDSSCRLSPGIPLFTERNGCMKIGYWYSRRPAAPYVFPLFERLSKARSTSSLSVST